MEVENLDVDQGADFVSDTYIWTNEDGTLVDLTGATALMQVRTAPGADEEFALTDSTGIALGGAAGTIVISIPSADTAGLDQQEYKYDILLTLAGVKTLIIGGTVKVNLAISVPS